MCCCAVFVICVPVGCETVHRAIRKTRLRRFPRCAAPLLMKRRSFVAFSVRFSCEHEIFLQKSTSELWYQYIRDGVFGNTLYRNSQNVLSYVVMKTTWIGFENIREAVVRQAQSACGMEENMSYKIVVDSCCELPEKYKKDPHFEIVPLGLEVGDYRIMDDEHFNQKEFLEQVASCPQCPRSSCPSPESYRQAFESEAEHIYVVTLSGNLSGSYNSAMVGRQMYLEEDESKQIYVMDSCSASCGETQLALLAASPGGTGTSL